MRELSADVYDTLDFSSLVFRGVGAPRVYANANTDPKADVPCCILGHAECATSEHIQGLLGNPIARELEGVGIFGPTSDTAVFAINKRKGRAKTARVAFAEWCDELGVVRGE